MKKKINRYFLVTLIFCITASSSLANISLLTSNSINPPVTVGKLTNLRVQEQTGNVIIQTAYAFSGDEMEYSLLTNLSGLSIDTSTGELKINTEIIGRRKNTYVYVLAKNSAGTVNQSFTLTVGPQLGMAMPFDYLRYKTESQLTELFDAMYAKNIVYMRCDLHWSNIESTKGVYVWESSQTSNNYGRIARLAEAAGLQVIWLLHISPSWAKLSGVNGNGPANAADFGKFAGEAAKYFTSNGFNVHCWEIWNEPNLPSFWDTQYLKTTTQLNSSAVYLAEMHIAAYNAIKAVDSNATVITAGLSSVPTTKTENSKTYVNPTDWLTAMYSVTGFSNAVDAIGIHPYVQPNQVMGTQTENGVRMMREDMRNFLISKGHGNKKVWITEFGAPTAGTAWNKVSEAQQSKYLEDLFDYEASTTWAGPIIWYTWFDMGSAGYGGADESENWFGAHRPESSAYAEKPVATILQSIKKGDNNGTNTNYPIINTQKTINIFPNPTSEILHIKTLGDYDINAKLFNLQGAMILNTHSKNINISDVPTGVYLLDVDGQILKVVKI